MARTDRLYDIIQVLRDGRLHRAGDLAAALGVTPRTIWRDMATLRTSGLAIEGERGVGYILRMPLALPQMMLTPAEMAALRTGLRSVAAGGDAVLARGARSLASKIAAVTPSPSDKDDIFAAKPARAAKAPSLLRIIRRAMRAHQRISAGYITSAGIEAQTDLRPLAIERAGAVASLIAYCEGRRGFLVLRLDRITHIGQTSEIFPREPGCELADFRAQIRG